jgi:hypothetical protein
LFGEEEVIQLSYQAVWVLVLLLASYLLIKMTVVRLADAPLYASLPTPGLASVLEMLKV